MFLSDEWLTQQGGDAPLLQAVDAAFGQRPDRVAVAVSGGGDSMALLDLAVRVCAQTGQTLMAVTVDHGLRAEAATEARMVADFCAAKGIRHDTLTWNDRPEGNVMAAARAARYRLMADWAAQHGIGHVLLGHTRDDVGETFLMALGRGAGVDGLSGMDAVAHHFGMHWGRPLLAVGRAELRDYLTARDVTWVEDPTNEDDTYLRVRVRKALPELAAIGLGSDQIATSGTAMSSARAALEFYTAQEAANHLRQQGGDIILPRNFDRLVPAEIQRRLWVSVLRWIGGGDYAPRQSALVALDMALGQGRDHRLNGCAVLVKSDKIHVTREWNAVRDLRCAPDQVWDRRWRLVGPQSAEMTIAAVGEEGIRQIPDWRAANLPRPSIISSPAIWHENTLIAAPLAGFNADWAAQIVAPWHPVAKHSLNL